MVRENSPPQLVAACLGSGNQTALSWEWAVGGQERWRGRTKSWFLIREGARQTQWIWSSRCVEYYGLGFLLKRLVPFKSSQRGCHWTRKCGAVTRTWNVRTEETWIASSSFLYFAREGHLGLEGVIGACTSMATELAASQGHARDRGNSPLLPKTLFNLLFVLLVAALK